VVHHVDGGRGGVRGAAGDGCGDTERGPVTQNVAVLLRAEVEEERLAAASDGHDASPTAR
jgi:hypothetical protein